MLEEIERQITTAAPDEMPRLQNQVEVFRDWLSAARTRNPVS
jgi:hypothetical protein